MKENFILFFGLTFATISFAVEMPIVANATEQAKMKAHLSKLYKGIEIKSHYFGSAGYNNPNCE